MGMEHRENVLFQILVNNIAFAKETFYSWTKCFMEDNNFGWLVTEMLVIKNLRNLTAKCLK